jgi:hypothetical protein
LIRERTSIWGRVLVLAGLQACLFAMVKIAEGGVLGLFLGHLGASRLPLTFLAISLLDVPLALIYMQVARRIRTRRLLGGLAMALLLLLAGARLLLEVHLGAGLFLAYVAATIINTFIVIQWGVVLLEFFTVEESQRAFPLVYVGAHLGGLIAGLALRHLALPLGTENLILVAPAAAGALVLALLLIAGRLEEGRAWRQGESPSPAKAKGFQALKDLGLLRTSSLLRAIAAATAVMVGLRLALRYLYGAGFEQAFPDTEELTRFIGTYTIIAAAGSLAMQVLFTPLLLRRLGAGALNVIYAYVVGAALLFSAVVPGLLAAVFGRAADQDLKNALKTPVSPMFYEALGEEQRRAGRALILGVISPLSSLLTSVLLVVVTGVRVSAGTIALIGGLLSLAYIVAAHLQSRAYRRSLEGLLLEWYRGASGEATATIADALLAAALVKDRRLNDMASEIERRRKARG